MSIMNFVLDFMIIFFLPEKIATNLVFLVCNIILFFSEF